MAKHKQFSLPVRVYFQDTDAGGVVYHGSYVNFLERARTEWLRDMCGFSNGALMKEFGAVFVVREMKVEYLKPALLDDMLAVTAQVATLGRSSVKLVQTVLRGEEVLTQAEVHLVCVSLASFKPISVPDVLREKWKN
ncbi:MAG: tol-pal system-associated acyl-CoA thioesterase [Sideroxydans sp.]|nr:tol-pal system-associated acyl-CoA thioesterase [Sideroxydans sp.]